MPGSFIWVLSTHLVSALGQSQGVNATGDNEQSKKVSVPAKKKSSGKACQANLQRSVGGLVGTNGFMDGAWQPASHQ